MNGLWIYHPLIPKTPVNPVSMVTPSDKAIEIDFTIISYQLYSLVHFLAANPPVPVSN